MDIPGKTTANIVSDTLTFMDDMGLSMAASDNPRDSVSMHQKINTGSWPNEIIC